MQLPTPETGGAPRAGAAGVVAEQDPPVRLAAPAIAIGYAIAASLWILLSDRALERLLPDPQVLVEWSMAKGLGFVAVTALLLWLLIRRALRAITTAYRALAAQTAELRAHEQEVARLSRLYAALSAINQTIVRASHQDHLLQGVCEVLVGAGFRLAWVGWHDETQRRLVPVASAGDHDGYLATLDIATDERPAGQGPLGRAFRSGTAYVENDLLADPATAPWRDGVAAHQLLAGAAFPIRSDGVVRGLLAVYAGEAGFFQHREVALLAEAASDVSFALDNFAREQQKRQAEEEARAERRFSETLIESTPGILYLYDEDRRFLRWNRDFERVSGYSGAEIASMQPLDFFAPADQPLLASKIAEVFAEGSASVEAPFLTKDGTTIPYHFTGRLVPFEGRNCLVGMGVDISERKRAELALRELNDELELRVAQRTAELAAAVERAEAADRLKSAFLATMSHELRTPLNSIIGFTGILLQGLAGPLASEQHKQLGMVQKSARHLLELINDVLDLSKIEAGQLEVHRETFSIRESVTRVTGIIEPLAAAKQLALEVVVGAAVDELTSDRRRVEQILLNLLNNAVKFTDRGWVRLTAEVLANESGGDPVLRLQVADSGIGIAPRDMNALFQPFRQLDTGLSRQHEGTGLGLAICRRLTTLLGGTISAESEPHRGSTFTLVLPLAPKP
jgi:PAS domain S-box-containing protein